MMKRIGTSLLLASTMLVSTLNLGVTQAYAAPTCRTISECADLATEARDNIADFMILEDALNADIAELEAQITQLRSEIDELEVSIAETELAITGLLEEIVANTEELERISEEIDVLLANVAERMVITQRMDNRNATLVLFTESADLTDFIGQLRFFNRIATTDADIMDQLSDLLDEYDSILYELQESMLIHEEIQAELEEDLAVLEQSQEELADLEAALREELYEIGVQRMSEEDALAAAEAAQAVLEYTPAPAIVTNNTSSSGGGGSNVSAGTNSGMTHPMPGSRVTSEFGPRWGGHHSGIDVQIFGARPAILAAASGVVTVNTWHDALGWYMIISHDINGSRVDTLYAHMEYQSPQSVGTVVSQGQAIGTQGNTGFSTGAHLHFEIHPGGFSWNGGVNPRNWIIF
ncbi:MAG: peptidoglycan DD-metalloendopeptidase family protein [Turicibacter sp.]|nr:peptidoglycan DD-metalloendopeptidase family protein [Turicibacter sp.]